MNWQRGLERISAVWWGVAAGLPARAALLCLVLVFSGAQALDQPAPSSGKGNGAQPSAREHPNGGAGPLANRGSASPVSTTLLQNGASEKSKSKEAQEATENWWGSPDWWLVLLTALLAFVTWLLVVHTRRLVTEAQATSNRQANETNQAIDIARRAADASLATVEQFAAAQNAFLVVQFADVDVRARHPLDVMSAENMEARYTLANYGATIALVEKLAICVETRTTVPSKGDSENTPVMTGMAPQFAGVRPAATGVATFKMGHPFAITENEWAAILRREIALYAHGWAIYSNVFGRKFKHSFLAEYEPSTKNFTAHQGTTESYSGP